MVKDKNHSGSKHKQTKLDKVELDYEMLPHVAYSRHLVKKHKTKH